MNMKGVTLLETMVVIAIISVLSVMGVNTINNFRKEASLDNAANEMVSMIRVARSKSMNGEVLIDLYGEPEKETVFSETGLPEYGIEIFLNGYKLIRRYIKADEEFYTKEDVPDGVFLNDDYIFVPEGYFYFARITGTSSSQTINIIEKGGSSGREITISEDFKIVIEKI